MLRYLWLVLPFWQAVQSVVEKADQLSPFIWSDAVSPRKEEAPEEPGEGVASGDTNEGYESS